MRFTGPKSMTTKLILLITLSMVTLLGLAGTGIFVWLRTTMNQDFDRTLSALTQAKAMAFRGSPPPRNREVPVSDETTHFFQAWWGDGMLLGKSSNLEGDELQRMDLELDEPVSIMSFSLPNGERARLGGVRVPVRLRPKDDRDRRGRRPPPLPPHPEVEVVVAKSIEPLEKTLSQIRLILIFSGLFTALLSGLLIAVMIAAGLRPLRRLDEEIQSVDVGELAPLSVQEIPPELRATVDQLNALIGRLESAFARERSFTHDAAHELRTPLAGLRATLEVALARERSGEAYRDAAHRALSVTLEMQHLVDRLLELARLGGQPSYQQETGQIDLRELIEEAVPFHRDELQRKNCTLLTRDLGENGVTRVETDPVFARRVVANLLENAVSYAPSSSTIEVRLESSSSWVSLVWTNDVEDPHPDLVDRCLTPLWRGDPARLEVNRHAGLGLTLSARMMEVLGGSLVARLEESRFSITMNLPREPNQAT